MPSTAFHVILCCAFVLSARFGLGVRPHRTVDSPNEHLEDSEASNVSDALVLSEDGDSELQEAETQVFNSDQHGAEASLIDVGASGRRTVFADGDGDCTFNFFKTSAGKTAFKMVDHAADKAMENSPTRGTKLFAVAVKCAAGVGEKAVGMPTVGGLQQPPANFKHLAFLQGNDCPGAFDFGCGSAFRNTPAKTFLEKLGINPEDIYAINAKGEVQDEAQDMGTVL